MLKASPDSYGLIAKLFHWILARRHSLAIIHWHQFKSNGTVG
jgi:hypothetical protein